MPQRTVADFDAWREAARQLLSRGTPPADAHFAAPDEGPSLFGADDDAVAKISAAGTPSGGTPTAAAYRVPKEFLETARLVALHRDPDRYDLLYRLLWRITHGEPHLLEVATDDDVARAARMQKQVTRDAHKAKAFVRFRKVLDPDGAERYVAWHRPDHRILRHVAPFFARRFPAMHWSILTPDESVVWDGTTLEFGPGVPASAAPQGDDLEDLWRTYYGSIFNPARIKLAMMRREMPARHWATLPETQIIPDLLADAPRRVASMIEHARGAERSAADYLPSERTLESLAAAAAACRGCDLHARATQTVFGRGPADARIVLIGEQPGDQEDLAGQPFIGPAGRVLDDAIGAAGLPRDEVYLTNSVKHFHWQPHGKRRMHQKPPARAMAACAPWWQEELAIVRPKALVCLGATAAQVVVGRSNQAARRRGEWLKTQWCDQTLVTWHPSAALRAPDEAERQRIVRELTDHLRMAAEAARA
jgi:DNA polymerase